VAKIPLCELNFQALARAFRAGDVAPVEITCNTTGKVEAYIFTVRRLTGGLHESSAISIRRRTDAKRKPGSATFDPVL
jgi:hypothetical protein